MNEEIDYNALEWLRQELDEVLKQACASLREFAVNRDNSASLQDCAKNLHQARGPLRMVGLKGADQLASEMEEAIADLQHGNLPEPETVLEVLMQTFLQLPDYLSRLHSGRANNPVFLLPVINSLREVRELPVLEECVVFTPDLTAPLPPGVYVGRMSVSDKKIRERALAARTRFQAGLLEWFRGKESNSGLQVLHDVLIQMQQDAGRTSVARLWWAAACLSAAMIEGEIAATPETRQMFGQLDRQIKRLADAGESVFEDPLTDELMKRVLYCIANTESSLACMQLIKTTYRLEDGAGNSDAEDESLAGCSDEMLQAVSMGAARDIERIKDQLESFTHAGRRDPESLLPVANELQSLGNMLDMVGIDGPGLDVINQAQLIRAMAAGEMLIDETALMDVADLLVVVEGAVHHLGCRHSVAQVADADGAYLEQATEALAREAISDITRVKEAIVEFIESPHDLARLAGVPGLLSGVRASLQLSGQERAAVATGQAGNFIALELLEQHKPLSDTRLELLADAVSSIEYYIAESGSDHLEGERILGIAEKSLAELGYACPDLPAEQQQAAPLEQDQDETRASAGAAPDKSAVAPGVPLVTGMQVIDADADEEILAIFIEEADEVLLQLAGQLPAWFEALDNAQALEEARRGFHTIKGSGRMVGALAAAEFAWTFENLLNRIIEGTVLPGEELLELLGQSVSAMKQLLAQVKNSDAALEADVDTLVRAAVMLSQPGTQPVQAPAGPVEEAAPENDPQQLEIFIKECAEHLLLIEAFLGSNQAPCSVTDSLYRSLHTLSGICATANISSMLPLANMLEGYFDGLYQGHQPAGADALDVLRESVTEMQLLLVQLPDMSFDAEVQQQLLARIKTLPNTSEPRPVDDPYAAMDSELLEVFVEEASELIDAGEITLRAWSEQPDSKELMDEFQRQLHTLKGGARMVDITPLGDLSHTLESLLTRVVDGQIEANAELFVLLHDSHDHLAEMLEHVKARELPAHAGKLQAVINVLGEESVPGTAPVAEPVNEPKAGTATAEPEADAACEVAADAGLAVEPETGQRVETEAEPVMEAETDSAVEPAAELVVEPAEEPVMQVQAKQAAGSASQQIPPAAVVRQGPELIPPPVERRKHPRARSEQVRVRSDLLDNMVSHAAEINIYRARMEQQISDYRHNLGELDQTIGRLREQLRQVEIETEAHILFRYEQQGDSSGEDFDPLEMDRYSNLQQLSRSLIESIGDLRSLQGLMEKTTRESEALFLQQSRVSADLQEGLSRSRMIPFAGLAPRLRRILRQSAKELGKEVNLGLEGAEGEMDRTIIDRMVAPLEHMLRNAVAHGIEEPAVRKQLGKSPVGSLKIKCGREGSEIVLRIEDDGAGIDIEAIRKRAIERKLLDADADIPDSDIMQFVLQTGFSTAAEVTQISGRGVGMDVVNGEVRQLGGSLHISSIAGTGTTFTVRLPYTMAINQALLVKAGEETFCIPLGSIEGIARFFPQELADCYQAQDSFLEYAENRYQLQHLGTLLGSGGMEEGMQQSRVPVLLMLLGEKRVAFQLESIIGSREIVTKPLGAQLCGVNGISGATILGDGRVVLILDVMSLSRMQGQLAAPDMTEASREAERLQVMVVDDSITVRKVTTRLLERNGFSVLTAKDGVDALGQLRDTVPDIMLLDIEMPRMDGFELATHMRNDERLKHVPVIMITSRTGDKHRQHAKQIGVNIYLGKPYQESELLDSIQGLIDADSREECA